MERDLQPPHCEAGRGYGGGEKHYESTEIAYHLSVCWSYQLTTYAQEGDGQICIRAFEDRNTNGVFDANEPLLTQGIGVNLMNGSGVTIDAKLLDDSPTAVQGVVCFQQLPIGDYSVVVTSADYSAVTPTLFNALVVGGSVPVRFDFGGQIITADLESTVTSNSGLSDDAQDRLLQGLMFGLMGAIVVMGVLIIVGMVIYFGIFNRRMNQLRAMQSTGGFRPVTGPMPAYQQTGTGSMPTVQAPPTTGSMPAVEVNNPLLNGPRSQ